MSKKKLIINFTVIVLLTLIALCWALKGHVKEVLTYLSILEGKDIIRIFLYGLSYVFVIGLIYTCICKSHRKNYSYKEGLEVAFVGSFFSGVTPSATGGQFGQVYILKEQGIPYGEGASILWKDFIIYQSVLVIYTSILMILRFNYYYNEHSKFFILVFFGFLINSGVIVFLFIMAYFPVLFEKFSENILKFLGKVHIIKNPEDKINSLKKHVYLFSEEVNKLKDQKKMIVQCVTLNIVRLTLLYAFPYFIAKCFHFSVHPSQLLDIITMSAFVSTVNAFFPMPGSSGGTEATFILIFQIMFTLEQTSAIMILWRFASYHQIILIGGFVFIYLKHRYARRKIVTPILE